MMTVPDAAKMLPTPWQTDFFGAGDRSGGSTAYLVHAPGEVRGTHARLSTIPRWPDTEGRV